MKDFGKLKKELEDFNKNAPPEMVLNRLEKWMIKELGVERLKDTGGVSVIYKHDILKRTRDGVRFTIHRIHPAKKGRIMIRRRDFKRYLYPVLLKIIEEKEREASGE